MRRTPLAVPLVLLVLGGCGGGEDAKAKQSISTFLMEQQKTGQVVALEQDEADCIAGGMVDGIGVEQLKEYGLLAEDGSVDEQAKTPVMEREDAETMVDSMFDCTDVVATVQDQLAEAMGQRSPDVQACLAKELDEVLVRSVLVSTFSGDQAQAQRRLATPLGTCLKGGTGLPDGD